MEDGELPKKVVKATVKELPGGVVPFRTVSFLVLLFVFLVRFNTNSIAKNTVHTWPNH